jgi:hypothetical protein
MRLHLLGMALALAVADPAVAAAGECPLPDQRPMLVVRMFLGLSVAHRDSVTPREWGAFLRDVVTPRFPDGLTVYDAYGQWLDPKSHRIGQERTKVIEVAATDTLEFRAHISEVADVYRRRFRQQSVGIVTETACAAF